MSSDSINDILLRSVSHCDDKSMVSCLETLTSDRWNRLIRRANEFGISLLLLRCIKGLSRRSEIPVSAYRMLQSLYVQFAGKNTQYSHELALISGFAEKKNIRIVALKGLHIAELVYGDIALRPMGDVDVLVRKSDFTTISGILTARGYISDEAEASQEDNDYAISFYNEKLDIRVDVHFTIAHPTTGFTVDINQLWARTEEVVISGATVSVLSHEDLILHQCTHIGRHGSYTLKNCCDLLETLVRYKEEIDWNVILQRAESWQALKAVLLTMKIVRDLLNAPVPDMIVRKYNELDLVINGQNVQEIAIRQIFSTSEHRPELSESIAKIWKANNNFERMSIFLARIAPPQHRSGSFKDIFTRWNSLLRKHSHVIWGLVKKDRNMMSQMQIVNTRITLKEWMNNDS